MFFPFNLLKSSTQKKYISSKKHIKKIYEYWRLRIFCYIFLGYIFFYFTRKSFTFVSPFLISDLHLSISDFGTISTFFYITYAFSKLFSGVLSDNSNPRYFMSFGLILTGIFNICLGFSYQIKYLSLFWILNAIFQGWGWPPVAKQLTYWYSKKERGLWWSLCSISHNIGGALIPLIVGYLSECFGWRYSLYIIGFMCIIMGFFLINGLRDIPESLGLPPIEVYKENKKIFYIKKTNNTIIIEIVLRNKIIWLLGISYFFIYIIKTSINDWIILYLINQKGYDLILAGTSIFWFEIGGLIGMISSGRITDKSFKGKRTKFIIICTILLNISVILFWILPVGYMMIDYLLIFMIGYFTFGPQMLIGLNASELVSKRATCTANGFVGYWGYIGAAITGYPLGLIINLSWNIYFIIIIISSIFMIPILIKIITENKNL